MWQVVAAVTLFILAKIGKHFIDVPPFDLASSFKVRKIRFQICRELQSYCCTTGFCAPYPNCVCPFHWGWSNALPVQPGQRNEFPRASSHDISRPSRFTLLWAIICRQYFFVFVFASVLHCIALLRVFKRLLFEASLLQTEDVQLHYRRCSMTLVQHRKWLRWSVQCAGAGANCRDYDCFWKRRWRMGVPAGDVGILPPQSPNPSWLQPLYQTDTFFPKV